MLVDDDDFTARHEPVVNVDVDRFADLAVELNDRAAAQLQQLTDLHIGATEHGRDLNRNVVNRFEIAGALRARFGLGRCFAFQLIERNVRFVGHALSPGGEGGIAAAAGSAFRAMAASASPNSWASFRSAPPSAHSRRASPAARVSSASNTIRPG